MVQEKQTKRERNIRSKLMAAIAMLLVSSIMMVSTTYAWFTLSTAPEVTGITTAVGANGNLEMALLPSTGLMPAESAAGDSAITDISKKNITWGNLVDVSDANIYGMDKIVLNPSALKVEAADENGNPTKINTAYYVEYPEYGPDGRPDKLVQNAQTAIMKETGFVPSTTTEYGVRAIGVSSGMTDRQLAYRNYRTTAANAMSSAKTAARNSLATNGNALANVVVKKAMNSAEGYVKSDLDSLRGIVDSLTNNVIPQIETAYAHFIVAYAASASGTQEDAWKLIEGRLNAGAKLLSGTDPLLTVSEDGSVTMNVLNVTLTMPSELSGPMDELAATIKNVNDADTKLKALEDGFNPDAPYDWNAISPVLLLLADPDSMTVNNMTAEEIKNDIDGFANTVISGGGKVKVAMTSGGGVYADVADHCGNYNAEVTIDKITYGGTTLTNIPAVMETKGIPVAYLAALSVVVNNAGAPTNSGAEVKPMSDTYGYILDLAFRTNAANSNLQLQQIATDRIYSDNTNEQTMGHGATMSFTPTSVNFTEANVRNLMKNVKLVFFNPEDGTVYATAKLDAVNAEVNGDGAVTAKLYTYTLTKNDENEIVESSVSGNKILTLPQNQGTKVSVLVYLDGNAITNADVAYDAATSVTGSLNLQFSSSATLVPMEYGNLHIPSEGGNQTPATTTTPASSESTDETIDG